MSYDIFISYRRDGGDTLAQLIYDRLTDRGYRVFLDIESLRSGKFNEKLHAVIEECRDVVVILPPNALERCSNEDDWLYLELSHAIKCRKNIVPVMMKGFVWPEVLPEALRELPNYNGIQDSKDYFDAVIDKMTSLLHSKPKMFHSTFGKLKKDKKKMSIKERIARKRKIVIAVLCVILAAAGGIGFFFYQKEKKAAERASNVSIILTPSEEMSASEYYDAVDILKERMAIFAGGTKYSLKVEKDEIDMVLPADLIKEGKIEAYLRCYLTRPTQLYIGSSETNDVIEVQRSDIENLESSFGAVDCIDLKKYSLLDLEEYNYFTLSFTDEMNEKIAETFGGKNENLELRQDSETNPANYYYYHLTPDENGNSYYFVDNLQNEAIQELVLYNYTNEPLADGFYFDILLPVEWESVREADEPGKYQCDIDSLSGPQLTMQYDTYATDITKGAYQDVVSALKKRLDTLETPYAFGYTVSTDYGISIQMNPERLNMELLNWIASSNMNLYVENQFYSPVNLGGDFYYEKQSDGSYRIDIAIDEYRRDIWKETAEQIMESEHSDIYLADYTKPIAKCSREAVEESLETGVLSVDNLYIWQIDKITEDYRYLLDFIDECTGGIPLPHSYTLKWKRYVGTGEAEMTPDENPILVKQEEKLKNEIMQICPTAQVRLSEDTLSVWLELEVDESLPEEAISLAKQVYELVDWEEMPYCSNIYVRCNKERSWHIWFNINRYDHQVEYYYMITDDSFRAQYEETIRQLIQKDSFFTQVVVPRDLEESDT